MRPRAYLWGEIIRGATERPNSRIAVLCESKISNLDMSIKVEEDVFGFEITVNDIKIMKIIQRQRHFSSIKLRHWVRETLNNAIRKMSNRIGILKIRYARLICGEE